MVHSSAWHGNLWVIEAKYKWQEKWTPLASHTYYTRGEARRMSKEIKVRYNHRQQRVALYQKVPGRS